MDGWDGVRLFLPPPPKIVNPENLRVDTRNDGPWKIFPEKLQFKGVGIPNAICWGKKLGRYIP